MNFKNRKELLSIIQTANPLLSPHSGLPFTVIATITSFPACELNTRCGNKKDESVLHYSVVVNVADFNRCYRFYLPYTVCHCIQTIGESNFNHPLLELLLFLLLLARIIAAMMNTYFFFIFYVSFVFLLL